MKPAYKTKPVRAGRTFLHQTVFSRLNLESQVPKQRLIKGRKR